MLGTTLDNAYNKVIALTRYLCVGYRVKRQNATPYATEIHARQKPERRTLGDVKHVGGALFTRAVNFEPKHEIVAKERYEQKCRKPEQ
jgi:hypothetical protein